MTDIKKQIEIAIQQLEQLDSWVKEALENGGEHYSVWLEAKESKKKLQTRIDELRESIRGINQIVLEREARNG